MLQTGEYLEPSGTGLEYDETYNDYYHHRFTYSDPMQVGGSVCPQSLYRLGVSLVPKDGCVLVGGLWILIKCKADTRLSTISTYHFVGGIAHKV